MSLYPFICIENEKSRPNVKFSRLFYAYKTRNQSLTLHDIFYTSYPNHTDKGRSVQLSALNAPSFADAAAHDLRLQQLPVRDGVLLLDAPYLGSSFDCGTGRGLLAVLDE